METAGVKTLLKERFGFETFRPGQEAVLAAVFAGRPAVAIMPTGSGKSLCYQLPALVFEGLTIVVSPLLSLMKDQVDSLTMRGIPATFINSSLSDQERSRRIAQIRNKELKLLYVAPERFRSPQFIAALESVTVDLFAVDEAHCISSWGHDFRPDYARLAEARDRLRAKRTLALTATATPEVRDDISRNLNLRNPEVIVTGFDRPNLFLEVRQVKGDGEKLAVLSAIAAQETVGIVYAATRRNVEKITTHLRNLGFPAQAYHAGLPDEARVQIQESFMAANRGVVVATNAFGMGVDRPDIRFVAHFDVPRSVEAYYQEIGRAGRDGNAARALLLFNHADVFLQERILSSSHPSRDLIRSTWKALGSWPGPADSAGLASSLGAQDAEVASALKLLERAGHVARTGRGFTLLQPGVPADALGIDFAALKQRAATGRALLRRIVDFAYCKACRRHYVLRYFGERAPDKCGTCDICATPPFLSVPVAREAKSRTAKPQVLAPAEVMDFDQNAYQALKKLRTELAKSEGVPSYVVFHDSMLRELARTLPSSREGFISVSGLGEKRWERYGEKVIAITCNAKARGPSISKSLAVSEAIPPSPPIPVQRPAAEPQAGINHTLALYREGLHPTAISERRGIALATVFGQLADLFIAGERIGISDVVSLSRQREILSAAAATPDLVAIRGKLSFPCTLGEIRLVLLSSTAQPGSAL